MLLDFTGFWNGRRRRRLASSAQFGRPRYLGQRVAWRLCLQCTESLTMLVVSGLLVRATGHASNPMGDRGRRPNRPASSHIGALSPLQDPSRRPALFHAVVAHVLAFDFLVWSFEFSSNPEPGHWPARARVPRARMHRAAVPPHISARRNHSRIIARSSRPAAGREGCWLI